MDKKQKRVLEYLIDSYEKSKTFLGKNQVNQRFFVSIGKLFPRYLDDAEYEYFCEVNASMNELKSLGLVELELEKNGVLKGVILNLEQLDFCYNFLGRMPRKREQEELVLLWERVYPHMDAAAHDDGNRYQPLVKYIDAQHMRIRKNQNVEHYHHDMEEYRDLLLAARAVLGNQEEIFIRNFSIQLFHDSKRMEQLKNKIEVLLWQYGEYQERDSVLEECGIVDTPTYVMIKGNGRIRLGAQKIDLSLLPGDIALSTESVKSLEDVTVLGERVVTVENLTSFHDYPTKNDFVVYLGGFHNRVKRDFLIYLHQMNREKEYWHFGDIDAGGFYILEHLRRKTGIPFRALHMNRETLCQYSEDTRPLTENDRKRLLQLKEDVTKRVQQGDVLEDYREVIEYMLEKDCKLEQEAIHG